MMTIDETEILQNYIRNLRSASKEEQTILSHYVCNILSCTQTELDDMVKKESAYDFLKTAITDIMNKKVPHPVIRDNLPIMKHLDELCESYEFSPLIKEQMEKANSGTPYSENLLQQLAQTFVPDSCQPDIRTVTGHWEKHNLTMTVPATFYPATREVTFCLPHEFHHQLTAVFEDKTTQPLTALSDILQTNTFQGTEIWYDASLCTTPIDKSKSFHLCVDKSGVISIDTSNDLLGLLDRIKQFYEPDHLIKQNEIPITKFYLFVNNGCFIGTYYQETEYTFRIRRD